MDGQMKMSSAAPARPAIPNVLLEATAKAIKAGMKPDELAKAVAQSQSDEGLKVVKKKGPTLKDRSRLQKREDEEDEVPERTYRNFDERRMGFLVVGDQHRFAGKYGKDRYIYPAAPPLDYSFCMINKIEEIVTENEQPQKSRNYRYPEKTPDERYRTSSIRLSYNVIDTLEGFVNVLYKILDGGPLG
jgi:hypothetical protein